MAVFVPAYAITDEGKAWRLILIAIVFAALYWLLSGGAEHLMSHLQLVTGSPPRQVISAHRTSVPSGAC